jgi:hypothetical protein
MEQEYPYLRIGTAYYKIVQKPLASGDHMTLLLPWSVECIKQDHGRSYLSGIPKYDGFCFVPSHLHYQRFIGNFYNRYYPFAHEAKAGQPGRTLAYLGHIFGDQLEYGLDYLKILLEMPMQMLPILCLVSTERNTGKTTFLNLLKAVFGDNMTINTNEDFRSNFNAEWAHKVIVKEVKFCVGDIQDWLNKKGFRNHDTTAIRRVLQNVWNLKPAANSNSYNQYKIGLDGTIYESTQKGRYFVMSIKAIEMINDS